MSEDLKAAQHLRQAAENELLKLKQKATEVAGKLELTGQLLQVCIHVDSYSTLMDGCSMCAYELLTPVDGYSPHTVSYSTRMDGYSIHGSKDACSCIPS